MELHSSKRIKTESKPSSSHQDPDLDFEALRWTPCFVDKTMLIRSILKDRDYKINLTAPPKFGKTMAKNMLQTFFEIGDHEQKLAKHKLFKDLKIYKCSEECTDDHGCESKNLVRNHCGQHPVISLDFAQLSTTSYGHFLGSLRDLITRQFEKYNHLIYENGEKYAWSSSNMGNLDIESFLRYLKDAADDNVWIMKSDDIKGLYILNAFEYLLEVLSAHYSKQTHRKIIVLIDEFDAPFMKMLFDECSDARGINRLIQRLIRLLCKDDVSARFVGRVVIFSVTTAIGGTFSLGANNVARRTFLDKNYDYYKFFGFTKEEVEALVTNIVTERQRQKIALDEIAVWYSSYTVEGDDETTICNPLSITRYLSNLVPKNYWVDSVGTKYVCQLFKSERIREELFPAIRDDHNISIIGGTIQLNDIDTLKSLAKLILNCGDDKTVVWGVTALEFFALCGYFDVIKKRSSDWILRIPNYELKETFSDILYQTLLNSKTNLFDVQQQESFVNALESLGCGKEHEPMKYLTFKKSVENLYTNRELPKGYFHFHCDLWMLIFGSEKFDRLSELPIKKEWSPKLDLIFVTKSGTGIVIEVKRDHGDSAKESLEQCLKKEYYKAFELEGKNRKILNTILMALHLSGDGKVSIRYLENFDGKTLSDEQNREALIKTIVEDSYECSDM